MCLEGNWLVCLSLGCIDSFLLSRIREAESGLIEVLKCGAIKVLIVVLHKGEF